MIDTIFFQVERQDATLTFGQDRSPRAMAAVERLPGVMRAEPFRSTGVILRNGHRERRLPGHLSFIVRGVEAQSLLIALDLAGIAASSGSACASGAPTPSGVGRR